MTAHATAQTNYYVSTTGSDNSGNGSLTHPWATIAHASAKAGPGTVVHVAAGIYKNSFETSASGTATAYVTYIGESADFSAPVNCAQVAANHGDLSGCVRLVGTNGTTWTNYGNYVAIKGFDVTGGGLNGIYTQGTATRIIGNHVHDILNSTCNSDGGSGINLNGTYAQVSDNYVHNIGPYPSACGYVQGIYFLQEGGFAYNNISFNNSGFGIQLWHYTANIALVNNTLFNNASGGIVLGTDNNFTVDYVTVSNNIVTNNGGEGVSEQGASSNSTGIHNIYTHNLVYGNRNGAFSLQNGLSATYTVDDPPLLVDQSGTSSGNYHLTYDSPAIDAATSINAPASDFDGTARPQHSGYDIGAYEYLDTAALQLSTNPLSFPSTSIGTTSAVEYVTVTNTGSETLSFSSDFSISGPFAFGGLGTCALTLPSYTSCTISVIFKPTYPGTATGAVTLTDDASGGTQNIQLSGKGL
jgi:hypothetical protein